MSIYCTTFLFAVVVILGQSYSQAQHCAPIVESFLSGSRVERSDDVLKLSFIYHKTGGRSKTAYPAYLLAYPEKNGEKIRECSAQDAIERKYVTIVNSTLAKRNAEGEYDFAFEIGMNKFVQHLLDEKLIQPQEIEDIGGWKSFKEPVRLAIFVPFLNDEKYSKMKGLPEDTHECNYGNESALLFDSLPHHITICFGMVQATRLEEGEYYLELNAHRPK